MTAEIKNSIVDDELLCRGCLQQIDQAIGKINLFDKFLDETEKPTEFHTISGMFSTYTSIEINELDEFPTYLCVECYQKLDNFHVFRKVCIASNIELIKRKTFGKITNINNCVKVEYNDIGYECVEDNFANELCQWEENTSNDFNEMEGTLDNGSNETKKIVKKLTTSERKRQQQTEKVHTKSNKGNEKTNSKQEIFICEICQRKFFRQHTYDAHIRKHNGLKQWACQECDSAFAKRESLKYHMEAIHAQERAPRKEYICGINDCGKVYYARQSFKSHIFGVHIKRTINRGTICEHCGKSFSSSNGLKKHLYIHTGDMPYKCNLCPKAYPSNNKLKIHIMRHEGIKNHVCPTCGLGKTTMHELRVHMNYHTREKLYPCKLCSTVFSNTGNKSRHMRIVHCGIRAYTCKYCDRSFGKAETLKHHEMTHTGEKPHVCSTCGKRFIQSIALKTHMRTHNKQKA